MAADFSRVRHHPFLDFAGVELKQGGVLLDADANELVAVLDRRLRALAGDVLGRARVSSTTPDAFRITAVAGGLSIGRGRLYVDGLLAENHGSGAARFDTLLAEPALADATQYGSQPYLPGAPTLPEAGRHLVYLDVWQRELTHLQMPALVETAVGVETSSRLQTVWQVRVLREDAGNSTCTTADASLPGWAALTAPSDGRLTTGTFDLPAGADPCELPPSGGYRGLENQLYRVQVHDGGQPGAGATFKWSRDNASVGARVSAVVSATELELDTLGRDDVLGFADDQWVEIGDDTGEFAQQPGEMRRITVDAATRRITFTPALPAALVAAGFAERHLRVTRWDQAGRVFRTGPGSGTTQVQDLDAAGAAGVIDIPAAGTTLLLEHGLTVSFASAAGSGGTGFKPGDWWVFAARTADASVEELTAAPPRGTHHHYARLGLWDVAAGTVTDCRLPWPPDTQAADCACTACVTPESHASGRLTIQAAVDRVRDAGGTVCLHAGTYALNEPVRVAGARSLAIRGQGAATVITAPGAAFEIEGSIAITIEQLAVVSLGRASAIGLRTVAGVRLAELVIAVLGGSDFRAAAVALAGICAGVAVNGNFIIAPDGIRAEPQRANFVLAAALAVTDNVLWCQRAGVQLEGPVAHMLGTRIAGNQFLGCRDGAVSTLGFAFVGASVRVEHNEFSVNGPGIACGTDGSWIEANKLTAARQGQRAPVGAAITLASGLDASGSNQAQVLANQVSGFSGAGVAVLAPVGELIVKLNIVEDCGAGIVCGDDADAGAVSIENNHLRDIRGQGDARGIAAAIAVVRAESAAIAGNTVRRVAVASSAAGFVAGVLALAVQRARVAGNDIADLTGPNVTAPGAGIAVRAPWRQAEVQHNTVARDTTGQGGGLDAAFSAALVDDGSGSSFSTQNSALVRTAGITTLRIDDRRTLVLAGDRAFVALADAVLDAAGAAVVRGASASLVGNRFTSRGRAPAVLIAAAGDAMFNDNRCDYRGGRPAVQISAPAVIVNANRVACDEQAITITGAKAAAVLGNVTTHGIALNGGPLPPDFAKLNLNG